MPVPKKEPQFIVVIGASAGGLHSIIEVVAQLKSGMDLSVLIVLHITKISLGEILVNRIQKNTTYTCKIAEHGETLQSEHLYIAPPDVHLMLKKDLVQLGKGPAENRWRPSIDVLFRSAAAAYNSRVVGIVLSGLMQDGTSGMEAIKRSGGTTVVQDPEEAEYPDMPLSVLNNVEVDYVLNLHKIGALLQEMSNGGRPPQKEVPIDIVKEAQIAERVIAGMDNMEELGVKSLYSCPDCGGGLWEVEGDKIRHFRCHIGHSYIEKDLLLRQVEALESTLWVATRMMEERRNLLTRMAAEEKSKGWMHSAALKQERAEEMKMHIDRLKEILYSAVKKD